MVRNKESTSVKDIWIARNISREDNREGQINYNTKNLNHEVPSAVQTVFKTTPKITNPPPINSSCDPFHPHTGHLGHRSPQEL